MITLYPLATHLAGDITVDEGQDHLLVFLAAYYVLMPWDPSPGEIEAAMAVLTPPPVPQCGDSAIVPLLRWEQ